MVYCPSCGKDNEDKASFCRFCGTSFGMRTGSEQSGLYPRPKESIGFGGRRTGEDLIIQCGLCGGQDFAQDSGRLDSKWGVTSFRVIMLTCKACGHIELFNKGRSIFDFD